MIFARKGNYYYICNQNMRNMNTKLTLTIEQSIIEDAKKYARKRQRSLSNLIENYLKSLSNEDKDIKEITFASKVNALRGSYKMPKDFNYKKDLQKNISDKYL